MVLMLLALCWTSLAQADEAQDRAQLNALFAQLKIARTSEAARGVADRIWRIWTSPSDTELAARMADAMAARSAFDLRGCLALLDEILADNPDYAEAWNQRATVNYLLSDFDAALADIDRVLEFEPRHFGALSGRAMIYLATGQRNLALRDIIAASNYHPFLSEKQLFPELLDDVTRI